MKNLLIVLVLVFVVSSCNDNQKGQATEESLPTNRLEAITSLDDIGDTTALKDSTVKE